MAKYSKIEVLTAAQRYGLIPVFYHADIEVSCKVLKACYDGGVRAFEFTNRGDFAHEVFGKLVKYAEAELPGMILGAGSIVDAPTAGKRNICVVRWSNGVAKLYVTIVEDLPQA